VFLASFCFHSIHSLTLFGIVVAVVKTQSNLASIAEDGTCKSSEDSDCEDDPDDLSALSDDFSFDTITAAFQSKACIEKKDKKAKKQAAAVTTTTKKGKKNGLPDDLKVSDLPAKRKTRVCGNTKLGLPCILDLWRDSLGRARISVQVQMLSGKGACKKVLVRVSTDGKELVICLPMSQHLARTDCAFETFLLNDDKLDEKDKFYTRILLKHHPKTASRLVAVSKIKGRSNTDGFYYEHRIILPRQVKHKFATEEGDSLFWGKKFVQYPDESVFFHGELVADTKDNYVPEERLLDPSLMKTVPKSSNASASAMDIDGGAQVLSEEDSVQQPVSKRAREGGSVVVEEASQDDGSIPSLQLGEDDDDAATLFQDQSASFAQIARDAAAVALKKAGASSLAAAAAEGRLQGLNEQ